MRLAIELEKRISKEAILERDLDSAYFGHRAYGIFAASKVFFSKTAAKLTPTGAALLAAWSRPPSTYDPAQRGNQRAATDRRNYVIDQMREMAVITAAEAATAKKADRRPAAATGARRTPARR